MYICTLVRISAGIMKQHCIAQAALTRTITCLDRLSYLLIGVSTCVCSKVLRVFNVEWSLLYECSTTE